MMKAALFSLLSILLIPSAFANGVERGHEVEVPAPIFTPLMQEFIAMEVESRCDFHDALGSLAVTQIRPRSVKYAGDRLVYEAVVNLASTLGGESPTQVSVTAMEEAGAEAPRVLRIESERCSSAR